MLHKIRVLVHFHHPPRAHTQVLKRKKERKKERKKYAYLYISDKKCQEFEGVLGRGMTPSSLPIHRTPYPLFESDGSCVNGAQEWQIARGATSLTILLAVSFDL